MASTTVASSRRNFIPRPREVRVREGGPDKHLGKEFQMSGQIVALLHRHLEKHMRGTPTQYIMWYFAGNEDKESIEFKSNDLCRREVRPLGEVVH